MTWGGESGTCGRLESQLSAYLDGELGASENCEVMRHLEVCADCAAKLHSFRSIGEAMRAVEPPPPPAYLALRLRIAASRRNSRKQWLVLARMRAALLVRTLAVPLALGMCAAMLAFGAFYGNLGEVIAASQAAPDVPLGVVGQASPPRLVQAANTTPVDAAVLVEAQVDANGRVYGYRVISGPHDGDMIARLNNQLLFSVFQPAMSALGQPTSGSVVVSYGTVHVRG